MRRLLSAVGRLAYYLSFPALVVYLHRSRRTRVLLVHDNHVLAVKGWYGNEKWGLPGGGLHRHESPVAGLCREVQEEVGISLQPEQLQSLGDWKSYYGPFYINYEGFWVDLRTRPEITLQAHEISHAAWLPLESISAASVTRDAVTLVDQWQQRGQSGKL